jgi:serine/threonine protein kinase
MSDESSHRPATDSDLNSSADHRLAKDTASPREPSEPSTPAPKPIAPESPESAQDDRLGGPPAVQPSLDELTVISRRPPVHSARSDITLGPRELGQTLVGRNLAHFQLIEFVGGGGMGAVFRASDTMLNRTVAVKVLSRDQGRDEETVKRFQNEAQSAARLDHENIARVYYVGEDDGWYFIVFEFIEGKNLRELVGEQGPLPVDQALQVILQISEALEHSATREVVHRDIKPSNVLLMPTGKAKLVDMGLARLRPLKSRDEDLTASGVTLGTFDYISPEQARDPRTADVRSDIYSLGCTWYYMLTGQPPFPEGTVLQKLLSHSSEAAPDPRRLRPDLPQELIPVMHKMLAKRPSDRYDLPADLISDLLMLAERLGLSTTTRGEAIWVTPRPTLWNRLQFHLPWVVPITVLLLMAMFWDPAWLDGSPTHSLSPRFVVPESARIFENPAEVTNELPIPERTAPPGPSGWSDADRAAPRPSPVDTAASGRSGGGPSPSSARSSEAASSPTNSLPEPTDARPPNTSVASPARTTANPPTAARSPNRADTAANEPTVTRGDRTAALTTDERPRRPRTGDTAASSASTLVVDTSPGLPRARGELVVSELAEACRLVLQNPAIETIEIRKQGRVDLTPLDLRLDDRTLKLVAGEGYSPILSFRAGTNGSDVGGGGMIQVIGGTLEICGVHLEMTVSNETLDGEWSLFELSEGSTVRVANSTLTLHNSYGGRFSNLDDVAVFNCVMPDRDDMLDPDMGQPREASRVELTDCIVRCEATVLRAREAIPIRFQWTNGLLVTSERLAMLHGATQLPRDGEQIELTLQHLTAVVDQGLAELSSTPERAFLMPTVINSRDCIWSTQRWATLITQSGPHHLAGFMAQLNYHGQRNTYEGMKSLWRINPLDGSQPESFDFEMWRMHWDEVRPAWQQVPWRYPIDMNRPIHEHRVADYGLVPPEGSTADAQPAAQQGFQLERLPAIPDADPPRPRKTRPFFQF